MPPVPRLPLSERRRAAARRRRRGQMRLAGLIVLIVLIVLVIAATAGGHSHHTAAKTAARTSQSRTSSHRTTPAAKGETDPLTTPAMTSLLAGRQGAVSVAVDDLKTGQEWILKPGEREQTASIVKADILETLLYQAQANHQSLDDVEDSFGETAEGMIEASDNDDATDLWNQIGAAAGLDAYDARIGMTETQGGSGGFWGETLTTAADQIKLLRQLALPHGALDRDSVDYQLSLMKQIDPGENWGVSGGVPATGVSVAMKNGWVPLTSNTDWEVNSIGWIDGDDHDYLIAVLTAHDGSEQYGIDTIHAMSKLIYDTIGPAPPAGTATINPNSDDE
jgi:hypothetical protein